MFENLAFKLKILAVFTLAGGVVKLLVFEQSLIHCKEVIQGVVLGIRVGVLIGHMLCPTLVLKQLTLNFEVRDLKLNFFLCIIYLLLEAIYHLGLLFLII